MRRKRIMCMGIVIAIAIALCVPIDASFSAKEKRISIDFKKINEPVVIGGPIKKEAKTIPLLQERVMLSLQGDIGIATSEAIESNPAITTDGRGNFLVAYERELNPLDHRLSFAYSTDGNTWILQDYWWEDFLPGEMDSHPTLDFCRVEDGLSLAYGTFVSTAGNGGISPWITFSDMTDPSGGDGWSISYLDWSDDDFYGCDSIDIACDEEIEGMEEDWVIAWTMSFPAFNNWPEVHQIPFICFHPEGDLYWCYWFYYNWSSHVRIDIDRAEDMIYLTFQWTNGTNQDVILEFAPESALGEWGDGKGEIGLYRVGGIGEATNPDVAADSNYIYLVCQVKELGGNEDIICFHSSDGGETWGITPIANSLDDELYPVIDASGSTATCIFTKKGNLYIAVTEDGGETWEILEDSANDEDGSVVEQYGCASVKSGKIVWTDSRGDTWDIYADNVPLPVLNIVSVSGGFGVKATVANIGTADAENVEWSITFDGPVFIGKEKSGTIDIPAGGEATIKSGFILGIGPATVTVNVGGTTKTASCFVLGPLVLGVK